MIEITCKCGKSKKRFFQKIGEFYIAECCEEAGYDHLGRLKKNDPDSISKEFVEAIPEIIKVNEDGTTRPATEEEASKINNMVIVKEENLTTKPKRKYNKSGKVKIKPE